MWFIGSVDFRSIFIIQSHHHVNVHLKFDKNRVCKFDKATVNTKFHVTTPINFHSLSLSPFNILFWFIRSKQDKLIYKQHHIKCINRNVNICAVCSVNTIYKWNQWNFPFKHYMETNHCAHTPKVKQNRECSTSMSAEKRHRKRRTDNHSNNVCLAQMNDRSGTLKVWLTLIIVIYLFGQ